MKPRTVQEFVEDAVSNCKTDKEIITIAQSTHWKNSIEEIKDAMFRLRRRIAKRKKSK